MNKLKQKSPNFSQLMFHYKKTWPKNSKKYYSLEIKLKLWRKNIKKKLIN